MPERMPENLYMLPLAEGEKLQQQSRNALGFIADMQDFINNASDYEGRNIKSLVLDTPPFYNPQLSTDSLLQEEILGATRQFIYDAIHSPSPSKITREEGLNRFVQSVYLRYGLGEDPQPKTYKEIGGLLPRRDQKQGRLQPVSAGQVVEKGIIFCEWFLRHGTKKNPAAGIRSWLKIQFLVGMI